MIFHMKRNLHIDFMRIIAAILVVIIHTPPFTGIHPLLTYSIVDVLPRIAVPYFFAISGYYFINSSSKKQLKQILSVARDYIVVSAVYIVFKILFSLFTNKQLQISVFGFILFFLQLVLSIICGFFQHSFIQWYFFIYGTLFLKTK